MFLANLNDKLIEPTPNTFALCPACGRKVHSKCGEIKMWHWAHVKGDSCDPWYELETLWHRNWKLTFGKENCEKVILSGNSKHIADVYTKENVVIELQNSSIKKGTIREREEFYGPRMLWVVNGLDFKDKFFIGDTDSDLNIYNSRHNACKEMTGIKKFKWEYPKRSWEDCQRHIFIDFHEEYLFWIIEGMGKGTGKGKFVKKEEFITKYGGDYILYLDLFRKYTFEFDRSRLRLKGIETKKIHLFTNISYNKEPRGLEIYFYNVEETFKIQNIRKGKIQGILLFEEKNKNLQLVNSRFI